MKIFLPAILSAFAVFTTMGPVQAAVVGLCGIETIPPEVSASGNANVNVNVASCQIEEESIIEVMLLGGATVGVGPVNGTDATAIETAIAASAPGLGFPPSQLAFSSLELIEETSEFIEEVFAETVNGPALVAIDYLGDPNDYSTWIAFTNRDVNVTVSQATVTSRTYRVEVSAVPLPATGAMLLIAFSGLVAIRSRRRPQGQ